jgi:hypothetical protein
LRDQRFVWLICPPRDTAAHEGGSLQKCCGRLGGDAPAIQLLRCVDSDRRDNLAGGPDEVIGAARVENDGDGGDRPRRVGAGVEQLSDPLQVFRGHGHLPGATS